MRIDSTSKELGFGKRSENQWFSSDQEEQEGSYSHLVPEASLKGMSVDSMCSGDFQVFFQGQR